LNFCCIIGNAYKWIKSYLSNRFQRVEIKHKNSIHKIFSAWGSILGPLLFPLYKNYLSGTINGNSKTNLFADDTSAIVTSSNSEDFKKLGTTEF
jgi:hypothetical protein